MSIFTGAATAIITPFQPNGEVNYEKLEELVDLQIDGGIDALVVCGTTGEASTLTHEEHIECIRTVVNRTKSRVPVIAGTGSNCTDTAIYLSKEAQKCGADALLLVTPYYNKATQKGLIEHFSDTAHAVDIPVLLYNVPSRTGCNIKPETALKLAEKVDNIVGIKEASGDISQTMRLAALTQGCLDIYSGNDDQIIPILSLGGKGVISVLANLLPGETHSIVAKYLSGDTKGARELQFRYMSLIDALFCEVNPIPVKEAMNRIGFEAGTFRKPLTGMEKEHKLLLEKELEKVGLLQ